MSFSKRSDNSLHTDKHVTRDPDPVVADFNAHDYATLVAHPSLFRKFSESFLCLVGLSRHYTLDEETYPWFLHKNGEGGNRYLCFHPYLGSYQIAPDRADSKLEASVERLFDEGGSGTQTEHKGSIGVGADANIQPVIEAANTVVEDAIPVQSRRQGKRKSVVVDAARVTVVPTLPFMTASVSTTPKRKDGDHIDFVAEPNLRTIRAPQRFVISSDSSHHSSPAIGETEVNSLVRSAAPIMTTATTVTSTVDSSLVAKEKPVKPSLFSTDSSSAGGADPNTGVFSDLTGSDFVVGGIRTMVDEFAPPKFFASICGMEHDQLFTEFNVGAARQMSLSVKETEAAEGTRLRTQTSNLEGVEKSLRDEVNTLKGRNVILEKERNVLDVKVTDLEALVVGKERDLTDLNAQLTSVHELEISSAGLQEKITMYDICMDQLEKFQDDRMKVVKDKLAKLDSDLAKMACHLEEKFYPHLLNTISGWRWFLTHGLKLFLTKCLNSSKYLTALGAAISRAIKKETQSGLAAGIDHELREVDFPLLAELKSHKDASTEDIMNVLCLEGSLVDALRMNDLQPDIEQLKVPIYRSEDQVVLGETSLSFALSVSHSRMERIRENITAQRSALVGVWTPLSKPLSVTSLMGEASTSGVVPAASVTTTALSTTFASASSIPPMSTDDYKIVGVDGQECAGTNGQVVVDGNVAPFFQC
nr:hypothetical protein [Tanacetum cinerariifolium]